MTDRFDIDRSPATPELLAIAEKELRETPEIVEKGLAELRKLLKQNPDLSYTDDDEFLMIILRTTHWYPESALKLVNCFLSPERTLAIILVTGERNDRPLLSKIFSVLIFAIIQERERNSQI